MADIRSAENLQSWQRFLQELELARHYPMPYQLQGGGAPQRNPLLDFLLPSLLALKLASILDEMLTCYIELHQLQIPKKYHKTLGGRIRFLGDKNLFNDYSALKAFGSNRNRLAHDLAVTINWAQLETEVGAVETELQSLNLVGDRPKYEYFGERSQMRTSEEPGVLAERDYRYGIKCDDEILMEISSVEKLLKDID